MHEMASEASTVPLFFFCVSTLSVLGRARFDMMQMRNETVCNGDHVEWEKGAQNYSRPVEVSRISSVGSPSSEGTCW